MSDHYKSARDFNYTRGEYNKVRGDAAPYSDGTPGYYNLKIKGDHSETNWLNVSERELAVIFNFLAANGGRDMNLDRR